MESAYKDPKKKAQLEASFNVVAEWAQQADPDKFSARDLGAIASDALTLADLARRQNPSEAMRHAAKLVRSMDEMIGLQKDLRAMPTDDSDRTNPQLRTALRRIADVRNKDVWHVQLT